MNIPFDFSGKKVTVMGLGLFGGGAGVARFLVERGARVTVTDLRGEDTLSKGLNLIKDLPLKMVLGGHREKDFIETDMVVANPAVPPTAPLLRVARKNRVPIETEMNLCLKLLKDRRIIGITGSNGKTTTSHLTYGALKAQGAGAWLGGNMGGSLLPKLDRIKKGDCVVLEMSSFQLEMSGLSGLGPDVGVITNLTPNHLDRHKTFEAYVDAKMGIFVKAKWAVINGGDPVSMERMKGKDIQQVFFSSKEEVERGCFLRQGAIIERFGDQEQTLAELSQIKLPGLFNVENIMAALLGARLLLGQDSISEPACGSAAAFTGVPHRLEIVAHRHGVTFINDSIATTPESCLAALEALDGNLHLIAGGYDKDIPLENFARGISRRVKSLYLIGATAPKLEAMVNKAITQCENKLERIQRMESLGKAVKEAAQGAQPGDTVLLSPGFASYDQFLNFEERGECFKTCIKGL